MSDEDRLHGFSTDDEDSSDEEVIVEHGIDVGKLPTVAKDDATVQKKLERAQRQQVRTNPPTSPLVYAHHTIETRQRRYLSQSSTARFLRGSTPSLFLAIWRGIASTRVSE